MICVILFFVSAVHTIPSGPAEVQCNGDINHPDYDDDSELSDYENNKENEDDDEEDDGDYNSKCMGDKMATMPWESLFSFYIPVVPICYKTKGVMWQNHRTF